MGVPSGLTTASSQRTVHWAWPLQQRAYRVIGQGHSSSWNVRTCTDAAGMCGQMLASDAACTMLPAGVDIKC